MVSIPLLFPVTVIFASLPLLLETDDVTIPTISPIAYPFPGFKIETFVILPERAVISNVNPEPLPVILKVETSVSVI